MGRIFEKANLLTLWLPFAALSLYLLQTTPLMIPGSDIWIHLIQIEHNSGRAWHKIWHALMNALGLFDLLHLANVIHKTQSLISFSLIFISARLILAVIFFNNKPNAILLNLYSWLAVIFWAIMHGFFAGPIYAAWFVVFANNYQIAYPTYFFGIACVIYGIHLYTIRGNNLSSLLYFSTAVGCVIFIALIHASELPYFILASIFLMIVFFKIRHLPIYLTLIFTSSLLLYSFFDNISSRRPALFSIKGEKGFEQMISSIHQTGMETLASEYGFNTFNYFFIFAFLAILFTCLLVFRDKKIKLNKNLIAFILLSSTPALMYLTHLGAGLLGMITYPTLAYRFTWSTFLFLVPSILSIYLFFYFTKFKWIAHAYPIIILIIIPFLSFNFENQQVSYKHVRSLFKALDPTSTRAGLSDEQQKWLDNTLEILEKQKFEKPICIDIYTAHYLYFSKRFSNVILMPHYFGFVGTSIDRHSNHGCRHPVDGGYVFKSLGITRGPWSYKAW